VAPVVGQAERFDPDECAGVGCVDHPGRVDDDSDVADVGGVGAVEDEVAGLERLPAGDGGPGVVFGLCDAWSWMPAAS
jgi:hypothetical protein